MIGFIDQSDRNRTGPVGTKKVKRPCAIKKEKMEDHHEKRHTQNKFSWSSGATRTQRRTFSFQTRPHERKGLSVQNRNQAGDRQSNNDPTHM
jgi:hypothetical protein